MPNLGKTQ